MCGRFVIELSPDLVARLFGLTEVPDLPPRYNVAPTQLVPVIREAADGNQRLTMMRWGLVPSWAKEIGDGLINARSEPVNEKPSFRRRSGSGGALLLPVRSTNGRMSDVTQTPTAHFSSAPYPEVSFAPLQLKRAYPAGASPSDVPGRRRGQARKLRIAEQIRFLLGLCVGQKVCTCKDAIYSIICAGAPIRIEV